MKLATATLALAFLSLAGPSRSQQAATEKDLSADARASVAQSMYSSTATATAVERAADGRISEQRREIESLLARLNAIVGGNHALQAEITAAEERFIMELAARDIVYAQEMSVFRRALTHIASTRVGARALRQFNSGDEIGALDILDDLRRARDLARAVRSQAELEADNRRIAILSLEARARAEGSADTAGRLYSDPQDRVDDEADRLILAGNLPSARRHLRSTLSVRQQAAARQRGDRNLRADVANLHDRLGDVSSALGESIDATTQYREALSLRRNIVATEPDAVRVQRAIAIGLYRLARIPGTGVTWADVARQFEIMRQHGILAERDAWALEEFRHRADAESAHPASPRP